MKTVLYIKVRVEIETSEPVSADTLFEDINYEFGYLDPNGPAKVVDTELTDYEIVDGMLSF